MKRQETESIISEIKSNPSRRNRHYATIVYEESAPENWIDILKDLHVPAFISPMHNKDLNPDGTEKKPHHHVMVMFDSLKSPSQARELFSAINGVGTESIQSMHAYARYLIHMDDSEKAPYNPEDVISLGGADYTAAIIQPTNCIGTLIDMLNYIKTNCITNFCTFTDICALNNQEWFSMLITGRHYYFIKEYIKSFTWELAHSSEWN